ncbi:MAG TPA: hypothetical protein VNH82_04700 [Candidatus Dormibacteraeota bacterium]|nr:hypothetical protein [Candidatus Dormibacteraeota bacterium]
MGSFERELALYETKRQELIVSHLGQYVVIHGDTVLGVYPNFADAYGSGVAEFGQEPFLVRQISTEDPTAQNPALYAGIISAHL